MLGSDKNTLPFFKDFFPSYFKKVGPKRPKKPLEIGAARDKASICSCFGLTFVLVLVLVLNFLIRLLVVKQVNVSKRLLFY